MAIIDRRIMGPVTQFPVSGSGGGGTQGSNPGGSGNTPPVSPPQGNPGGASKTCTSNTADAGGGGGSVSDLALLGAALFYVPLVVADEFLEGLVLGSFFFIPPRMTLP